MQAEPIEDGRPGFENDQILRVGLGARHENWLLSPLANHIVARHATSGDECLIVGKIARLRILDVVQHVRKAVEDAFMHLRLPIRTLEDPNQHIELCVWRT